MTCTCVCSTNVDKTCQATPYVRASAAMCKAGLRTISAHWKETETVHRNCAKMCKSVQFVNCIQFVHRAGLSDRFVEEHQVYCCSCS